VDAVTPSVTLALLTKVESTAMPVDKENSLQMAIVWTHVLELPSLTNSQEYASSANLLVVPAMDTLKINVYHANKQVFSLVVVHVLQHVLLEVTTI
jgi:hypothetical protein